jgi:hypothetical protein
MGQEGPEDGEAEVHGGGDRDGAAAGGGGDRERQDDPTRLPGERDHQQTYYRWRREYGGLKLEQAKRLKELERENARLKRLVAELSLDKQILQDVARGNL